MILLARGGVAHPLDGSVASVITQSGANRSGVQWAVAAESLDSDLTLASRLANEPLKPASNLKILTTAALLDLLGPDHRIPTTVHADGRIENGTLRGDLWILGFGDPSYTRTHVTSALSALGVVADGIRDAGIRRVTGDLIVTGLFVYANASGAVRALGGSAADTLALSNDRRDRGRLTPSDVGTARIVGQTDFFREANRAAGNRLRTVLGTRGVQISGSVRTSTRLEPPGRQIARRLSPPVGTMIRPILHSSINLHSDLLLIHLGYVTRGELRLRAGIATARAWLAEAGADLDDFHIVDGSGLSHRNRMTANQLLAVLRRINRSSAGPAWRRALPLAGRSGTLAGRFRGTHAEGNMRAKTGTLTGVVSLSGFVTAQANGEDLAFVIFENSPYERPLSNPRARSTTDRIANVIGRGVRSTGGTLPMSERFPARATDLSWETGRSAQLLSGIQRSTPGGDGRAGRLVRRGPGEARAVTGPSDTERVAVEAAVHLSCDTSVDDSSRVPYQGLVVRAEGDDWIRFVADFDRDRSLKIQARIGGEWQRLAQWTFPGDFPDPGGPGWHRMRLELRGNEIRAFFDRNPLPGGAVRYSRRPTGRSGVYVHHWGGSRSGSRVAHFDDFQIEALP